MGRAVFWLATLGGAVPGLWLVVQWYRGALGVVPDEALLHLTGRFGLSLLVLTLALGAALALTGWRPLFAARRPAGLWAFAYLTAHAAVWLLFDQGGYLAFAWAELVTMAHLQLGVLALLLLLPLAVTSTDTAVTALGRRRWQRLHRLVWPATLLALVHAWQVQRFESTLVLVLAAAVLVLLVTRLAVAYASRG